MFCISYHFFMINGAFHLGTLLVTTPLWGKCEDDSHSQKWELGVLRDSRNFRVQLQRSKHLALIFFHTVEKVLKCRCLKWPRMSHSDICSTSYGRKKGRESNCQFDSRPLKIGNRPNSGVCKWSAAHHWKALEESYKFSSDLVSIRGLSRELWAPKVSGIQTGQFWDSSLGDPRVPGIKAIRMRVRRNNAKNTIWGKVVASPKFGPWWVKWIRVSCGLSKHQECFRRWTNQLLVGFDAGPSN